MNLSQLAEKYLKGVGTSPLMQTAIDYGAAAALGAGGQQLANWTTGGEDPNPLLSGALFSPLGALGARTVRNKYLGGKTFPIASALGMAVDESIAGKNGINPLASGALMASAASGLASTSTNAYNLITGQNAEPSTAISALSSIAPIAYYLLGRRGRKNNSAYVPFEPPGLPQPNKALSFVNGSRSSNPAEANVIM